MSRECEKCGEHAIDCRCGEGERMNIDIDELIENLPDDEEDIKTLADYIVKSIHGKRTAWASNVLLATPKHIRAE